MATTQQAQLSLETAKNQIRAELLKGSNSGLTGVGLDPRGGKLIVFVNQAEQASSFLTKLEKKGLDLSKVQRVQVGKGQKNAQPLSAAIIAAAPAAGQPVSLTPPVAIVPQFGEEGILGCFVSLPNKPPAALTVGHIFQKRVSQNVDVRVCQVGNGCLQPIGSSPIFGSLQSGVANKADCALFSLNPGVGLKANPSMSERFVSEAAIAKTEGANVTNLATGAQGQVMDITAAIKYSVVFNNGTPGQALFEGILISGSHFGVEGNSGSAVVMAGADAGGAFGKGDVLGLYAAIMNTGSHHFVTPLHACLTALEATAIYQPPPSPPPPPPVAP